MFAEKIFARSLTCKSPDTFAFPVVTCVAFNTVIVAPTMFAVVMFAVEIFERPIVSFVTFAFEQFKIPTLAFVDNNVPMTLTPTFAFVNVHVDPVCDCGPSVKLLATATNADTVVIN